MNKSVLFLSLVLVLSGCVTTEKKEYFQTEVKPAVVVSAAPDLSNYSQIELYEQGSGKTQPPVQLVSRFIAGSAHFNVLSLENIQIGRLHVQPEDCRNDPNPGCERRFSINGRLQAIGLNLSCLIPVRNDTQIGYSQQTLTGLCQSQYGRAYTLQMSPK